MPKSLQRCVTSLSVFSREPSSSRKSMRSRADILPSLCCLSRRCAPPPSSANWSRLFSSAIFSSSFIGRHYRRGNVMERRPSRPATMLPRLVLSSRVCWTGETPVAPLSNSSGPRGRGVKHIQEFDFLFWRQEGRLEGVARQLAEVLVGEAERFLHQRVLLAQRCTKHRGIVGIERQHQALVEVAAHRMLREFGAAARPQIAGHTDFNRNLALGQLFNQFRILRGSKAVADAFRLEVQCAPDGFRPCTFTSVSREMKIVLRTARVGTCEPLRRTRTLVAAYAEGNYVAIAKLDGEVEHALRFLGAELSNGIEYPHERNAEVFLSALAATFQALENRGEILFAPEADADRNNNLPMQDVLRFQSLHQPVCNQLVVFWGAEMSRHILESRQEACEVFVVIEPLHFGERRTIHPVTLPQFEQSRRLDRAFEMQMELGLRELEDEAGGLRRHGVILKDSGITLSCRTRYGAGCRKRK